MGDSSEVVGKSYVTVLEFRSAVIGDRLWPSDLREIRPRGCSSEYDVGFSHDPFGS